MKLAITLIALGIVLGVMERFTAWCERRLHRNRRIPRAPCREIGFRMCKLQEKR